ncbi:MAG: ribosomal protein S18-alanine N-acetyltransferase [Oscillospiraceae bacterium]|nr:ribosomal protein S18-alanine N-acetyltransferase [Oscillospiraceae bacterium]
MSKIDEIYYVEKISFNQPWTKEMLESEINGAFSVSVTESVGGKVCAYAIGRVVAGEAELFRIAVMPEFRRKGIAEKLMRSLHGLMRERDAEYCFLEVRKHNTAAVMLYEKLGYERLREIPRYYPDDDAVVMRCVL